MSHFFVLKKKCYVFLLPLQDFEKAFFFHRNLRSCYSAVAQKCFLLSVCFCRSIGEGYLQCYKGGGMVKSQERVWFVLIMMLGKALRLFLQVPKSRVYLFIWWNHC